MVNIRIMNSVRYDKAAPNPMSNNLKEIIYPSKESISLLLAGPPPVSEKGISKIFNSNINLIIITKFIKGTNSGKVIYLKHCILEAPSIAAASYGCVGRLWSPEKSTNVAKGMPRHIPAIIITIVAYRGSNSQFIGLLLKTVKK